MLWFNILPRELISEILNYIENFHDLSNLSKFDEFNKMLYDEYYWINRTCIFMKEIDKNLIKNYLSFNKNNLNTGICNYINMINTYNSMKITFPLYMKSRFPMKFTFGSISNIRILTYKLNNSEELILSQLYICSIKISPYILINSVSKSILYYKSKNVKVLERNVTTDELYNLIFHIFINGNKIDYDTNILI